jgi:phosphate/sulfate permease
MQPYDFVWLFVLAIILAFCDGFGIGANDVANSFSTSVSSKSLTLKQACAIAVFSEFLGAFLLGAQTADTIRSKILNLKLFVPNPALLMLAMTCALFGSATWTIVASKFGWPVSTTHSIVGAVIGTGIASFGTKSVDWTYKGFGRIAASWFISPAASAVVASIIFLSTKYLVLERKNSFEAGLQIIPLYFGLTAIINTFFIFYKGTPRFKGLSKLNVGWVFLIAGGIAAVLVAFCYVLYIPYMRRRILDNEDLKWYHVFYMPLVKKQPTRSLPVKEGFETDAPIAEAAKEDVEAATTETARGPGAFGKLSNIVFSGLNHDVVSHHDDPRIMNMHDSAKKYDNNTEILYSFLQVFTATLASFAHGSNDVANAAGPLSAVYEIYRTGKVNAKGKSPVQLWILALGGLAIDVGLLTYGWHVFAALGNQITYHSPSRGFSMELGSALTVLTASKIGLPVSTTHCITGATVGVGLCNGNFRSINWRKFAIIFLSWLVTVPAAGTAAGLVMFFGSKAPKF